MKKFYLLSYSILCSVFFMGQGPVAVDDSASIQLGETITINVIENDYHPDGLSFKIIDAYGAFAYTDSTITYFAEYQKYYNAKGDLYLDYTLMDENGGITEESMGNVVLNIENYRFSDFLDINNIRAKINCWGNHFYRGIDEVGIYPDEDTSMFEFPNGSGKNTIFNQALWIGGLDQNAQLKIAAERYRQVGFDFWTGPLSVDEADLSIKESTVIDWNRVWKLDVEDIIYHKYHWSEQGYEPIEAIASWPAHGNAEHNQSEYLAPFIDMNGDNYYNPYDGDYPLIRGDQCIFFIMNDMRIHSETGGQEIGLEIHGMAYEFRQPFNDPMHSTVFLSYKVFNRSAETLNETYVGLFTDFDIGYAWNDYVGCDVARGAFYGYNGEEIDVDPGGGGYGHNPPAQGIVILGGPTMDPNGMDDPGGECDESINGVGFGDGIPDNERYGMNKFLYYNNSVGIQGAPSTADEYYNYMKGIWKDGTAMEYGGNGHVSSGAYGPSANFMFPGLSDECYWGTDGEEPYGPVDWTEETASNEPDDRRGLSVMGPFTFLPGAMHKVDMAFVTARGAEGPSSSVQLLKEYIDVVKQEYYEDTDYFGYQWLGTSDHVVVEQNKLKLFPNPAGSTTWIDYTADGREITCVVHDIYGREVLRKNSRSNGAFSLTLEALPKGLYIVSLIDGSTLYTAKLMKE